MIFTKFKMPNWRMGIPKIHVVLLAQIRDILLLVFVLLGLIASLGAYIWLILVMPTGS